MRSKTADISKKIIKGILITSVIIVAASSPGFTSKVLPNLLNYSPAKWSKFRNKRKYINSFYYLKRKGYINFKYKGKQLYISLSRKGKSLASKIEIDTLIITKPEKWDRLWRVLVFDIKDKQKVKREALRGKLKELNFYQLQDSVWVCPYKCQKEINTLRDFFLLAKSEMNIITASHIEEDYKIRNFFNII